MGAPSVDVMLSTPRLPSTLSPLIPPRFWRDFAAGFSSFQTRNVLEMTTLIIPKQKVGGLSVVGNRHVWCPFPSRTFSGISGRPKPSCENASNAHKAGLGVYSPYVYTLSRSVVLWFLRRVLSPSSASRTQQLVADEQEAFPHMNPVDDDVCVGSVRADMIVQRRTEGGGTYVCTFNVGTYFF